MTRGKKIVFWSIAIILLVLALMFYFRFYYVFGEGVKTGQLNYVVKKGYIFKTYEGKMIQSGFRTTQPGSIQSNEFEFSIQNKRIADSLMRMREGKEIALHYREYFGAISWRGYSKFIVDSIVSVHDAHRIIPDAISVAAGN
ncbi:MAG: hypothetical protein LBL90_11220 [Prevotellaceae bacterium]|jgi:hypothetical protein|nr:hypothetical protein [Prevotellaceae bacterium]